MTTSSSTRLPENVHPVYYSLTLEPDLDTFTFVGRVEIEVTIESPTVRSDAERVRAGCLQRFGSETAAGWRPWRRVPIEHDEQQERVTLRFPSPLPAGQRGAADSSLPAC